MASDAFKKSYVLIDNFDKFDLDVYAKRFAINEYKELAAPFFSTALVDGEETIINNYATPFAFDWKQRPDLLRFLTNRRFYLSKSFALSYPGPAYLWTHSNFDYVQPEELLDPLEGKRFLISLTNQIGDKINNNFALTNSFISFNQYFSAAGYEGSYSLPILPMGFGSSNVNDILEDLRQLSRYIMELQLANRNTRRVWDGAIFLNLPKLSPGKEPIPSTLPSDVLDAVKVLTLDSNLPGLGGVDGISPLYWTLFRLINRLLSFTYNEPITQSTVPALRRLVHLYFVGNFPIGTLTPAFGSSPDDMYGNLRKEILSIHPFYNYYAEGVTEVFSQQAALTEKQLPNIYTFYAYKSQPDNIDYYSTLVDFGLRLPLQREKFKISEYYKVIDATAIDANNATVNRYKKIVFGQDLSMLDAVKTLKKDFPYGVQIDLPQVYKSDAIKIFQDHNLVDLLTSLIANYSINVGDANLYAHKFILQAISPALNRGVDVPPRPVLADCQIFDLTEFYNKIRISSTGAHLYLKNCNDYTCVKFTTGEKNNSGMPYDNLNAIKFNEAYSELWTYFNQKKLRFWEIYGGKKCHTEVLLFEIAKFKINEITGVKELVQSIFIPNLIDAQEMLSYIDTQVFVGHVYTYEIFTHTLLIGHKYKLLRNPATTRLQYRENQQLYQLGYTSPAVTAAISKLVGNGGSDGAAGGGSSYGWSDSFSETANTAPPDEPVTGEWDKFLGDLITGDTKQSIVAYLDTWKAYQDSQTAGGTEGGGGLLAGGGLYAATAAAASNYFIGSSFMIDPDFVSIGFGGEPTIINLIPTDKTYPYSGISDYLLQTIQPDASTAAALAIISSLLPGQQQTAAPDPSIPEGIPPVILEILVSANVATGDAPTQEGTETVGPGVEIDLVALIVRAPYYNNVSLGTQQTTTVTSKPPLPPDIGFYPYNGVDNKVLILLNQALGTRTMLPIPVFDKDQENINVQFAAQKYEKKPSSKLIYESDDTRGHWEIYRTTQKPGKYADFQRATVVAIDSTKQSGYDDKIMKNVDYYYIARFVDMHGNISNPTIVFYLRIVKEGGFPPYMILKEYNMTNTERNVDVLPFKKFIKIRLKDSIRNVIGSSGPTAEMSYQTPGSKELTRYKFRITSKKTGKQIDINVRFDKRIIDPPPPNFINPLVPDPTTTAVLEKTVAAENINVGTPSAIKENPVGGLSIDGSSWGNLPSKDK